MRLLIAGYSTRGFAECFGLSSLARDAEWSLVTLDYFGDSDGQLWGETLSLSRDFGSLGYSPDGLAEAAATIDYDAFAYVSGVDNRPDIIERLTRGKMLLGNTSGAAAKARDFERLYALLGASGVLCPETHYGWKGPPPPGQWLYKPMSSGGGTGIEWASDQSEAPEGYMLQAYADGRPASVSFVADGSEAVVIGLSEQLCGLGEFGAKGFTYCGNIVPLSTCGSQGGSLASASGSLRRKVDRMVGLVVRECGLRGLNGIDFLVTAAGDPMFLEVNPRYCASMELYRQLRGADLFGLHAQACGGKLGRESGTAVDGEGHPGRYFGKAIVYAPRDLEVTNTGAWYGLGIRDVPHASEAVSRGAPVCTVLASGRSRDECLMALQEKQGWVIDQLTGVYGKGGDLGRPASQRIA